MSYLLNLGLRTRLLLLVVLALLPPLVLSAYNTIAQRQLTTAAAQTSVLNLLQVVANGHQQLVDSTAQILKVISNAPSIHNLDPTACNQYLADILSDYPSYSNLAVADPQGNIWCSATKQTQPVNIADLAWFRRALQTQRLVLGEYQIGRISGQPVVSIAYPVISDDDRIVAVIAASIKLDWLNRLAAGVQLPSGSTISLFDENGVILTRYPDPGDWIGTADIDRSLFQTILQQNGQGTAMQVGPDGLSRLFGFVAVTVPSEGGHIYLAVGFPDRTITAQVNHISYLSLTGLTLTLALALIVAWAGSRAFLLRPFNSLLAAARRLHKGDLAARAVHMTGAGELGELARNFNAMAEELERRQTAQARVESDLRRSTERYRIVSELISDYAYAFRVTPAGLEPEWVTGAFEHITGYTVAESESRGGWSHLIHPDDRPVVEQRSATLLAGQPDVSAFRIIAKDGRVRWLCDYGRPVVDGSSGRVIGIVGAAQDITARKEAEDELARLNRELELRVADRTSQLLAAKQTLEDDAAQRLAAEAALRASENQFRRLFEQANDAIFLENEDDEILDANSSACRLLGYSREELLSMKVPDLMSPETRGAPGQVVRAELAAGRVFEAENLCKDGTRVPLEISTQRIAGVPGHLVLCIARDITERKRADAEIQATLAKEQELNELRSRVIATTSHEFRTPLSTILSVAQLLQQHGATFSRQKQEAYLRRIQTAVNQMAQLIEDILTIGKFTAGKMRYRLEPLNLPELCMELIEEVEAIEKVSQRIDLSVNGDLPVVQMDAQLLRHILHNLLSNALKYSLADDRISLDLAFNNETVMFRVTDHGPGIPEDELPHLFEPFFRGRGAMNVGGSGLGMTIVRESVQLHGGTIAVQSTVGAGTMVTVNIPVR